MDNSTSKKQLHRYLIVGASSDVGTAFIRELLEENSESTDRIEILAHYAHHAQGLIELQQEFSKTSFTLVQADLTNETDTQGLVEQVREWGCPDAFLFLPACRFEYKKLKSLEWEDLNLELSVEVRAFALLCKQVLPLMAKQKYGKVAVMLTEYTLGMPPKFMSHYVTAKYALYGFMKAMASEYGSKGININGISPAMMETKFLENIDERIVMINAENNAMKRNVQVSEVVKGLRFLLSEGSDYMSGVNLNMSGGNR